jgi:polyisoprenoid-binding protein YceI
MITDTRGTINVDSGMVNLDAASGNKIYIRLDMTSINTQNSMRDDHLKNKPEFFDVAKNKTAVFEATEISKNEGGEFAYTAKGKLTLKGVTKDVTLNFNYVGMVDGKAYTDKGEVPANVVGFKGKTTFNRVDFGIGESGFIADDVDVEITIEASQNK